MGARVEQSASDVFGAEDTGLQGEIQVLRCLEVVRSGETRYSVRVVPQKVSGVPGLKGTYVRLEAATLAGR
jgi:hypothetical protein